MQQQSANKTKVYIHIQIFSNSILMICYQVEITLDELGPWCAGCVALNLCSTLEKIIDKTTERLEKQLLQLAWTQLKYIHSKLYSQFYGRSVSHQFIIL